MFGQNFIALIGLIFVVMVTLGTVDEGGVSPVRLLNQGIKIAQQTTVGLINSVVGTLSVTFIALAHPNKRIQKEMNNHMEVL